MTLIVVGILLAESTNFFFSQFFNKNGNNLQTIASGIIILVVAIFVAVTVADRGTLGNPYTLKRNTYYKVLSVTPVNKRATVVILRDGSEKTFAVKFVTQIEADTNGVYTLSGHTYNSYTLVPVK